MNQLLGLRTVLVTGKGGVGKTTVAASLARYASARGKRVLCCELGSESTTSSPLGEALGAHRVDETPAEIAPNLRISLLTPTLGHQTFLRDVMPMRILADAAMRTKAIRRFLTSAPTFPEMGVLYRLLDLLREKRRDGNFEHEMIIVDLPATGHALALAQIPATILRVIPTGPVAAAVREGLSLLNDAKQTGALIVTLPETLPVSEAIELAAGVRQHKVPIAQIVVNRVPFDPFTEQEREIIRTMLENKAPTLGERSLERIDRARVAVKRLETALDAPLAVVHDVWLEGPRLAEEVASLMAVETTP